MSTPPNRDVRITVVHPTKRTDDSPMALSELAGWRVSRAPGGSNTWTDLSTLLPPSQLTFDALDQEPGTWQYRVIWEDALGQTSNPAVTGISVPMPAPPQQGTVAAALLP